MSNFPSLKAREILSILFAHGFAKVRTSGSHIRLRKNSNLVTVPFHAAKTVPRGTLKSIIRQSGLTVAEFLSKR
ncbi:type II toxin-antitoxin system HicA family toxin [Candidatus Collierbacteria bacterium]|nr:type II toxin-antitoxin system HicA family toxin [Candidatus Collierbacteria bacterium]